MKAFVMFVDFLGCFVVSEFDDLLLVTHERASVCLALECRLRHDILVNAGQDRVDLNKLLLCLTEPGRSASLIFRFRGV